MPLLVLAYPELNPADAVRIEMVRAVHDPNHAKVRAHFTLVSPLALAPERHSVEELVAFVGTIAREQRPFPFVLRSALPFPDTLGPATHVFLVPDEGFGALVRLRDRLYSGPLARDLRLDIPAIPHVTIGRAASARHAKRLADSLNARPLAIAGEITALYFVAHDGGTVRTIARLPLGES